MVRLSKRLARIAAQIPPGSKIADIGSDHALLPTYLAEQGIISYAVASELNQGPYQAMIKQVNRLGLQPMIQVRLGDGLRTIDPGEVDVLCITGMGGILISSILSQGMAKLSGVQRLILQPNTGERLVRRWLLNHHWLLAEEEIVEEDGKFYEILIAVTDAAAAAKNGALYEERELCDGIALSSELILTMGPRLISRASPVFIKKWANEVVKMKRNCRRIGSSSQPLARQKWQELKGEILRIEGVLNCLQKRKRLCK